MVFLRSRKKLVHLDKNSIGDKERGVAVTAMQTMVRI